MKKVSHYKERVITWMIWWPSSVIWTLLDDLVKNIFNHIYNGIHSTLQGISNRIFSGVAEE